MDEIEADRPTERVAARHRGGWLVVGPVVGTVVAAVLLPTLLPDAPAVDGPVAVVPDPSAGVDHGVEAPPIVAPQRITRVAQQPPRPVRASPTSGHVPEVPSPASTPTPALPVVHPAPHPEPHPDPGPGRPPRPDAPPESPEPQGPSSRLAVRHDDVPDLVASLVGGEVDDVHTWDRSGGGVAADFRLDGFALWLSVTPSSGPTPWSSCREWNPAPDCHRHPDGSVHVESTDTAPEADGGATSNAVSWWTVDGWEVGARSSNAPEPKEATPTRPEPGLSIEQLLEVTGSDAWFDRDPA